MSINGNLEDVDYRGDIYTVANFYAFSGCHASPKKSLKRKTECEVFFEGKWRRVYAGMSDNQGARFVVITRNKRQHQYYIYGVHK